MASWAAEDVCREQTHDLVQGAGDAARDGAVGEPKSGRLLPLRQERSFRIFMPPEVGERLVEREVFTIAQGAWQDEPGHPLFRIWRGTRPARAVDYTCGRVPPRGFFCAQSLAYG